MNEKELEKAEKVLKTKEKEFEKKVATQTEDFAKHEKEFQEKLKARDIEFDEHVKETRKELEKRANDASKGISSSKGCYRDSSFWKSEEGIALKAEQAKK